MKKILFINIYQDSTTRGAETFITELSKRLAKQNSVEIFSGGKKEIPVWKKTFLWRIFLDPNSLAVAGFTLKNLGKIIRSKYNIVIPLNGGWQPAFIRIATWLYGGKMVIPGQSGIGWHDKNNLWCFPDAFVALSTKALNWARKVNPFVKSVYIPNGVDLNKFKGVKRISNTKTVLAVGAFTEQKRLDLTIKAVSKLKNVKLILVGERGDRENYLENLGRELLGDKFKMQNVAYEKIPEIYREADVFTLPSKPTEAFGNVIVEAMASGLPVVVTDDPIRREIVGDAGIFVDPTDIENYSKALDKAFKKVGDNQPRKQAEKFSWDSVSQKYEALFQDINS